MRMVLSRKPAQLCVTPKTYQAGAGRSSSKWLFSLHLNGERAGQVFLLATDSLSLMYSVVIIIVEGIQESGHQCLIQDMMMMRCRLTRGVG